MNASDLNTLEIELTFTRNIFVLPMLFETGERLDPELSLFDLILLDANGAVNDWTEASSAAQ